MAFDLKAKVEELVDKIKNDKELGTRFQKNPIETVEKLLGVDLPDEQIKAIVDGIKSKLKLDDLGGMIGGLFGKK